MTDHTPAQSSALEALSPVDGRYADRCRELHALFSEAALCRLEAALGVKTDRRFPDAKLKRTQAVGNVGADVAQVYKKLTELAQFRTVEGEG